MYTGDHHARLQDDNQTSPATAVDRSVVAGTKASTLGPVNLDVREDGFDDLHSITTAATTADGGDGFSGLQVPSLGRYTKAGEYFSCPVCKITQRFNGQLAFK